MISHRLTIIFLHTTPEQNPLNSYLFLFTLFILFILQIFLYPTGFRISSYNDINITKPKVSIPEISKNNLFNSYSPPLSFSILSLLFHISFIHLISLSSSFSHSFFPPLSHFATSIPHVLPLSPHSTFCTFFPLLPSNTYLFSLLVLPRLNLAIIFLSFHSLSPGIPEFPLSYTSHTPLYRDS
jgi:hypothetical protein